MKYLSSLIFLMALVCLTSCGGKHMRKANPTMVKQFEAFIGKEKFVADGALYTGVKDELLKVQLTTRINMAATDFREIACSKQPTSQEYVNAIKNGLDRFSDIGTSLDTEERERICAYLEELMDIVGLESSEGQLNTFMYGFDPGKH